MTAPFDLLNPWGCTSRRSAGLRRRRLRQRLLSLSYRYAHAAVESRTGLNRRLFSRCGRVCPAGAFGRARRVLQPARIVR